MCPLSFSTQDALCKISPVAYVDLLEGDAEGYVRFKSPADAQAVSDTKAELQRAHSWQLEILSGPTHTHTNVCFQRLRVEKPQEKK